jgi:hypothetical protein
VTPRGNAHAMLEGAGAVTDAPKPAPFYRIRLGIGDGSGKVFERFWLVYVPSADKLRAMDGQWVSTTTAADRALDRVTRARKQLPAKKLKLTQAERDAQSSGTSLPPEIVTAPPDDGPGSGSGRALSARPRARSPRSRTTADKPDRARARTERRSCASWHRGS